MPVGAVKRLATLVLVAALVATPAAAAPLVGLVVPVFDGPEPVARNVATTLHLQAWRTLRRKPFPARPGRTEDFGTGIIYYSRDGFQPANAAEIADYVRSSGAQLLMWGSARPIGADVVVQAFVAAPANVPGAAAGNWQLDINGRTITLPLPRQTFDFDPVVLSQALLAAYRSPDLLRMCDRPQLPCNDAPVGSDWKANRQEGAWANITASDTGRTGWLHLPSIDRLQNDASRFAAALIAYYRGDFVQAGRFFRQVATRDEMGATRNDAAVLALIAAARDGAVDVAAFERLSAANPDWLYAFRALIMARLQAAQRLPPAARQAAHAEIAAAVARNADLFGPDDAWANAVAALAAG
jgi:hypothetical protein